MPVAGQPKAESGFTLLETLVALTVLGFLMVVLVQGVRTGLMLWNVQTRHVDAIAELDSTARTFRRILTTIPVQPTALAAPVAIEFEGQSDRITLVGTLPTALGIGRRVDMTIHLQAGRVVIAWAPHRHDPPEAAKPSSTATELIGGVEHLEFAYWGSVKPEAPAAWLTRWEGPALPGLIRVRVRFSRGDDRHWPDLIVAPQVWNPQS